VGGAAGKVVAKLLAEGLVEEIQSRGSLPVWRRDGDGAGTLSVTKRGLWTIWVDDEATAADERRAGNLKRRMRSNSTTRGSKMQPSSKRGRTRT
jgi:hypothetical protein